MTVERGNHPVRHDHFASLAFLKRPIVFCFWVVTSFFRRKRFFLVRKVKINQSVLLKKFLTLTDFLKVTSSCWCHRRNRNHLKSYCSHEYYEPSLYFTLNDTSEVWAGESSIHGDLRGRDWQQGYLYKDVSDKHAAPYQLVDVEKNKESGKRIFKLRATHTPSRLTLTLSRNGKRRGKKGQERRLHVWEIMYYCASGLLDILELRT